MTAIQTTDVVNGTLTDAGLVNANFGAVKAAVNGQLDNANLAPGAAIAPAKIAPGADTQVLATVGGVATWQAGGGAGGGAGLPIGSGTEFWGASVPAGWLFADGSAISRTTYAALFAVIGTAFGAGDGSTTFNLPDKRGRVSVGMGTHPDNDALGDNDGVAVASRSTKHKHTVNDPGHTHTTQAAGGGGGSNYLTRGAQFADYGAGVTSSVQTGVTVGPQGSTPVDGSAYIACNYMIYAGV